MGVKHSNINTITNYSEWTEQNFEKKKQNKFQMGYSAELRFGKL